MSLISGILGHATAVDIGKLQEQFTPLLIKDEKLIAAYKLVRDLFVFTNKRLILVDTQGVTGKKKEYHTIPYKSITHFSKESADLPAVPTITESGTE